MSEYSSPPSPRLLLVDDDADILLALTDLLTHSGYCVTCAASGQEAIREFARDSFAAVILDLGLRDLHGTVVLKHLLTHRPTVPIIVLTAFGDEIQKAKTLALGAYSFLTKPYDKTLLQSVLMRAVATLPQRTCSDLPDSLSTMIDGILHQGPAVIQVKDAGGQYLFVNRQWEQLFHRIPAQMHGRSVRNVFPAKIAQVLHANDVYVLQTKTSLITQETVLQNGMIRLYRSLKFPLFDCSDVPYAVCGIATELATELSSVARSNFPPQ